MKLNESIIKNLKEAEQTEIPSYDSFRSQILNDLEMYYEDLDNGGDDVFAGTQDSYANEMIEQHLFDTILYNIKHNYKTNDEAMEVASTVLNNFLDKFFAGEEVSLKNDKLIKEIYDKYVVDFTGDGKILESTNIVDSSVISRLDNIIADINNAMHKLWEEDNNFIQADPSLRFKYENICTDIEGAFKKLVTFKSELEGGDKSEENS